MGSLAKGFLRKLCGKFAEICKEMHLIAPGKGAEILRKFRGNLRKIFCNDPFPNDPISELLSIQSGADETEIVLHADTQFNAHGSTPTPVFRTSRDEAQTMVQEKLRPKLRPRQTLH